MPDKVCHTCRRRRVKCDRSLTSCKRCLTDGLECQGYGKLFLWNQGVASRGKMMGKTFDLPPSRPAKVSGFKASTPSPNDSQIIDCPVTYESTSFYLPLVDPSIQDFSPATRFYLFHFHQGFCKELVIYDVAEQNPGRQLLRYAHGHPVLLQSIIATSAHHLYKCTQPGGTNRLSIYNDALVFKDRAIRLLKDALANVSNFDMSIMLAAVMLFIYVEFMSGDCWRAHLDGAKALIGYIKSYASRRLLHSSEGLFIRRWLVSEILFIDIIGSTHSSTWSLQPSIYGIEKDFDIDSILTMVEINSFSSFPAPLLKHILALVQIADDSSDSINPLKLDQIRARLGSIRKFDPFEWASKIQLLSPRKDIDERVQIASAYKSATCLYVSRMLPPGHLDNYTPDDRQTLVSSVIDHISQFTPTNDASVVYGAFDHGVFGHPVQDCYYCDGSSGNHLAV
ncbi:hypothetical protein FE257_004497 [Aspergillus nanangensis]|uniref:Zn(2)-C6 fungal-type domain-containing protein n=1 Tax=Aspergillus nanangensis TaxID=2582783 RepID=A0AAD4CYM3_ASPNN|nr:hypothetical protein FE257_004497 [Aspergillus nanangensis]